jgi:hypothetical protein
MASDIRHKTPRILLGHCAKGYGYWRDDNDRYIYQTSPTGEWIGWYCSLAAWESTMHRTLYPRCAHCGLSRQSVDNGARMLHIGTPGHFGHTESAICCGVP